MGIDIIRAHDTGKLFALECNAGGGHWPITSDFGLVSGIAEDCSMQISNQPNFVIPAKAGTP